MDVASTLEYTSPGEDPDLGQHTGRVELMVSCEDLANLDTFSKTDPMCVLFVRQFGQWKEIARTEAVEESLSPQFTETFVLEYDAEHNLSLMFSVYDTDCRSTDLRRDDHVGSVETTLGALVRPDQMVTNTFYTLRGPGDPQGRGEIRIVTEFMRETRSRLQLHIGACKLNKKGLFHTHKTDTYLEICRNISSTDFHAIYRTETVHKSQNPRWRPWELSVQKLSNGDADRLIQFRCWKVDSNKQRKLIGMATSSIRNLTNYKGKTCHQVALLKPSQTNQKGPREVGQLRFLKCRLDMAYTLLDYVRGGCTVRLMAAIDFTSSNGNPDLPSSLHYLGGTGDNQYIEAIKVMGSLLSYYDNEQLFPVYGFGATWGHRKKEREVFPLSGNKSDPYCHGIEGVIETYRSSVVQMTLGGPSRLAPVIRQAMRFSLDVQPTQENQSYWTLMIVTDGVVNDIDETVDVLVRASSLPLSVAILGVGPADFTLMEQFQVKADNPLQSPLTGKFAERENVCFAAFRKQKYASGMNTVIARETFAKVSSQMISYFKSKEIVPNRPQLHHTDIPMTTDAESSATGDVTEYRPFSGPMCPACGALIEDGADPKLGTR